MARVCMLVFVAGLWLEMHGLLAELTEENTGAVFVSQQTAHTVLRRLRRYNHGLEEVLHKDNLERECREETCSYEEAREVFENDEATMEFWAGYVDGDQCDPQPCQNGGRCKDGVNSYVCWCQQNFGGKNCEIELTKQCSINNGGCSHFCMMLADRAVCKCAAGYRLGPDKKSCEPTVPFSCGQVTLPSGSVTRTFLSPRSSNKSQRNSSETLPDDYYDEDISQFYDYFDRLNDSDVLNISQASAADVQAVKSDSDASVRKARSVTESPTEKPQMPFWAFPTRATIVAKDNLDQRVVGGDTAIPGEIPWQVTLMSHSVSLQRAQPFCGGSLISELWVVTAAHCLTQTDVTKDFFVRVGEHDITEHEGPERDHMVAERYLYPSYDFTKSQYNHDIALLKLANPVELSNQRRPICLGPKDFIQNILRESSNSLVSGWGRLKFMGLEATKLQKLAVPYVDRTLCKQSSGDHITRNMFCAGFSNEHKDACQGDSGGPHATNYKGTWFLTGIVSWGEECAKDGKYGIYTRMARYYGWISKKTGIQMTD